MGAFMLQLKLPTGLRRRFRGSPGPCQFPAPSSENSAEEGWKDVFARVSKVLPSSSRLLLACFPLLHSHVLHVCTFGSNPQTYSGGLGTSIFLC